MPLRALHALAMVSALFILREQSALAVTLIPPTKLVFSQAPTSLTAGICSSVATVELENSLSRASSATSNLVVALAGADIDFYSDSKCQNAETAATIKKGNSSVSLYLKGDVAEAIAITASADHLTSAKLTENVSPGVPTQITFGSTSTRTVTAGTCSQSVSVYTQDAYGNFSDVATSLTLTLSGAQLAFYSDNLCENSVTEAQIPKGGNSTAFYLSGKKAETTSVTATSSLGSTPSKGVQILAASPAALAITTAPQTVEAGVCSSAVMLQSQDAFGNPANVTASTVVGLGTTTGSGLGSYADAKCSHSVSSVSLAAGGDSAQFYFSATHTPSAALTASATGLGSASQTEEVMAGVASQLSFLTEPSNVQAAAPITPPIAIAVEDAYGNSVTSSTASITLALKNNPSAAVLGGNLTVGAAAGVASFPGITVSMAALGDTLQAASSGLSAATSSAFNVSASVTITVDESGGGSFSKGFSGVNSCIDLNAVEFYSDPNFQAYVSQLNFGYLRYPCGTGSSAFDVTNTMNQNVNPAWVATLNEEEAPDSYIWNASQNMTDDKLGSPVTGTNSFVSWANSLGASALITANGFTDVPENLATEAAEFSKSGVSVLAYETGNEPYLMPGIFRNSSGNPDMSQFVSQAAAVQAAIRTQTKAPVTAYWAGAFPYAALPNSPASVPPYWATTTTDTPNGVPETDWDMYLFKTNPNKYWDGVSIHVYPLNTATSATNPALNYPTMTDADKIAYINGVLVNATDKYVQYVMDPLIGATTPIYVSELSASLDTDTFGGSLYNGIFLAEYVSRMSQVAQVKSSAASQIFLGNSEAAGLIRSVNDFESFSTCPNCPYTLASAFSANGDVPVDTTTWNFGYYLSATGVAMSIANAAITPSTHYWTSSVSGGDALPVTYIPPNPTNPVASPYSSTINSVYAAAYAGNNGKSYVLITNKDANAQTVNLNVINTTHGFSAPTTVTVTTVSTPPGTDPGAYVNSASNTTMIQAQQTTSVPAISIPIGGYSVTRVEW